MFEWGDYLALARSLVASPEPSEATARSAASRAYYAAFHKSRGVLERELGAQLGRERLHPEVIRRLRARPETRMIGRDVDRLFGMRSHADYNGDRPFPLRYAEIAVGLASDVLRELGA